MTDLLETASNWLGGVLNKHASKLVVYTRGAASVEVRATIGHTTFELQDALGVVERFESRDYLVPADKLVLPSIGLTLPEQGDRIKELDDSTTFVYEVMAPGKEPHYTYNDRYRTTLRIHTKEVDRES